MAIQIFRLGGGVLHPLKTKRSREEEFVQEYLNQLNTYMSILMMIALQKSFQARKRPEIVILPLKVLFKNRRLCKADLRPEQKELFKLPRIRVFVLAIKILLCLKWAIYEHFSRIAKGVNGLASLVPGIGSRRQVGGLRHQHKLDILHFFNYVGWEAKICRVKFRSTDDRYQLQHKFMRAPMRGLLNIIPAQMQACGAAVPVARKKSEAVDAALNGRLWSRSSRGCYSIPELASWWLNTQFRFSKGYLLWVFERAMDGVLVFDSLVIKLPSTGIASLVQLRRRGRSKYVSELQARDYWTSYRFPGSQAFLYDSLASSIITLLLGSQLVKLLRLICSLINAESPTGSNPISHNTVQGRKPRHEEVNLVLPVRKTPQVQLLRSQYFCR